MQNVRSIPRTTAASLLSPELQAYADSDFSGQGTLARALAQYLDDEAKARELHLSDVVGSRPPFLTPLMDEWYSSHIASVRTKAIQAVRSVVGGQTLGKGGKGRLFESEMDEAEDTRVKAKRAYLTKHRASRKTDYDKIDRLQRDVENLRHDYGQREAQLGRPPKITYWPLYGFMLFCIAVAEAAINFESFSALRWMTPAVALGTTLVVGCAIAMASHLHGTFLRQWEYYFAEYNPDIKRGPAWQMFGTGSALFVTAMSIVYYARSTYLADLTSLQDALGTGGAVDTIKQIGGALLGNFVVYLLGVGMAWYQHDADPEYPRKKIDLDRKEAYLEKLTRRLDAERERELGRIDAQAALRRQEAEKTRDALARTEMFAKASEMLAEIRAVDSKVLGLLQAYRSLMVRRVTENRRTDDLRFMKPLEEWGENEPQYEAITPDRYLGLSIQLKFNV